MIHINEKSNKLIEELIQEGWEFSIAWTQSCSEFQGVAEKVWDADFTRKKSDGLWDNHQSGISESDPNLAIQRAYENIKKGRLLQITIYGSGQRQD